MHWIDWLIMTLPLLICGAIAIYTRRYVRSVADFMAGGRAAGRYLLCTARSEQGSGAAVYVAAFQGFLVSGFALVWWGQIAVPIEILMVVTGFVIYRYRQTRAMTLGQFFEMRYSRGFRLFAGAMGFFAGLLNFGIIPAVGAQFMVEFLRWPETVNLFNHATYSVQVPTFLLLMGLFLTICVIMTTTAGQVSVLLTDCAEGMFSQVFYTAIAVALLVLVFKWSDTKAVLMHTKVHESMVNPFDTMNVQNFTIWLVLMKTFGNAYRRLAWQNSHAFNSSAATPHEARMGGVLGRWRLFAAGVMVTLLSVCALTYFKTHTAAIDAALANIQDPARRDQMRAPVTLSMMLPVGVKGMLLSICLMGIIAGDGIHLHSWGSIFIQDVVLPLRQRRSKNQRAIVFTVLGALWAAVGILASVRCVLPWIVNAFSSPASRAAIVIVLCAVWGALGAGLFILFERNVLSQGPLTARQHVRLLRGAIVGVALWAFVFGAMFPPITYVGFWWGITEAIFVSGAGVAIIGGLYWSRGTSAGAWTALIVGSIVACAGIGVQMYFEQHLHRDLILAIPYPDLHRHLRQFGFHVNIPTIAFFDSLVAIACYLIISHLTCRAPHNMDQLLHRGAFGVPSDLDPVAAPGRRRFWLYRVITFGIDQQFSRADRWVTIGITLWSMFWFAVFAIGTLVYFLHHWSSDTWAIYWLWTGVYLPLAIGAVTTVWFTWGCTHDMIAFFRRLRTEKVDEHDDGTVGDEDLAPAERPAAAQLPAGQVR
jgi:SSS family solute:Na+ symporter